MLNHSTFHSMTSLQTTSKASIGSKTPFFRGNQDKDYSALTQPDTTLNYGTQDYHQFRFRGPDGYLGHILEKHIQPGDTILELGCNGGNNAVPLASKYKVFGVDTEKSVIDKLAGQAESKKLKGKLEVKQWDFAENGDTPWPEMKGKFKAIYAVHVLSHLSDERFIQTMQKMKDQLAPGGVIVFTNLQTKKKNELHELYLKLQLMYSQNPNYEGAEMLSLPFDTWKLQSGFTPHSDQVLDQAMEGLTKVSTLCRPFADNEIVGWGLPKKWLSWQVYQKPA